MSFQLSNASRDASLDAIEVAIGTPLTPVDGVVFYPWGTTDTAVARKAAVGLFEITWPGNLKESVPSEGYERITISDSF